MTVYQKLFRAVFPALVYQLILYITALVADVGGGSAERTLIAGISALLVIPLLIFFRRRNIPGIPEENIEGRPFFGRGKKGKHIVWGILCFASGALLSVGFAWVMQKTGINARFSNSTQEALLSASALQQVVFLGAAVPIAEEMTYRWMMTDRLTELMPEYAAVLVSALIFAAGHGNTIQFLYALPMGIILGLSRKFGGSMTAPILMHMGANLATVIVNVVG